MRGRMIGGLALVTLGLTAGALARPSGGRPNEVTYIPSANVKAAFARGEPLVEVPTYKVHASRRVEPGRAEIHGIDTDLVYVLEGSATLVTGGSVVAGETVAPQEVRGEAITNGQAWRLDAGDFMAIPAGMPHWFEEVEGPFLYYVVKVPDGAGVR